MGSGTKDLVFGFNHPAYCDWKVAIKVDDDTIFDNVDDVQGDDRPEKRQKLEPVCAAESKRTFLVSAVILGRHSEYFRSFFLALSCGLAVQAEAYLLLLCFLH